MDEYSLEHCDVLQCISLPCGYNSTHRAKGWSSYSRQVPLSEGAWDIEDVEPLCIN